MAGLRGGVYEGQGGERGEGGGGTTGWSLLPIFLFLLTGAGLFLMPRDTPHWLRVSAASLWNGGNGSVPGKMAGMVRGGGLLLSLHWGIAPHCLR